MGPSVRITHYFIFVFLFGLRSNFFHYELFNMIGLRPIIAIADLRPVDSRSQDAEIILNMFLCQLVLLSVGFVVVGT